MTSDVALRIAYFSLYLVGGFVMVIMVSVACLATYRLPRQLFLPSIALCSSRIVSAIISSLLLFSGSMTGRTPPETLCIVQSGLHNAQAPFLSSIVLSYAIIVLFLICPTSSLALGTNVAFATVLTLPFVVLIALSIVSISQTKDIVTPLFYCSLNQKLLTKISIILDATALFGTILVILAIFVLLSRRRKQSDDAETIWIEPFTISIFLLGLYTAVRAGFWIANYVQPTVISDMLDAADGIILFLIVTTQGWLRGSRNARPVSEKRASNGRVAHVRHHSTGQPVSVPSVIDIRAIHSIREEDTQSPKLLALATALGLDDLPPPTAFPQSMNNPSPKLQLGRHPIYAIDGVYESQTSLKNMQYGVALGHPSRDATPAHPEGRSDETPHSLIVPLPRASNHSSLYTQEGDLAHDVARSESYSYRSPRHRANCPSPMMLDTQSRLQTASAVPSSTGDGLTPEPPSDNTQRSSFVPVSVESRGRSVSPRTQSVPYASHGPPPLQRSRCMFNGSVMTVDVSTEEGAYWSTSSENNPPILSGASASSFSWPNASPASYRTLYRAENSGSTSRLGISSPSPLMELPSQASLEPAEISQQYETVISPPSPSSSNGRATFRPTSRQLPVPSPEPHPFARGITPYRPPGLNYHS